MSPGILVKVVLGSRISKNRLTEESLLSVLLVPSVPVGQDCDSSAQAV